MIALPWQLKSLRAKFVGKQCLPERQLVHRYIDILKHFICENSTFLFKMVFSFRFWLFLQIQLCVDIGTQHVKRCPVSVANDFWIIWRTVRSWDAHVCPQPAGKSMWHVHWKVSFMNPFFFSIFFQFTLSSTPPVFSYLELSYFILLIPRVVVDLNVYVYITRN